MLNKLKFEFHQTFMIEGQILNYCGPLFFSRSEELRPENVEHNGSFGLVDTGQKKLLVTCHHVLDGKGSFRDLRSRGEVKEMAILLGGGYPIRLNESQLIDTDKELDLATFDMEPMLTHCFKKSFFPICTASATKLKPKDILAIVGYVGAGRTTSTFGADFQYEAFGLSVSDVQGMQVVADLSKTKTSQSSNRPVKNLSTANIGGMSGSPCFKLSNNLALSLAAFVTSDVLGILRMTHAKCILPDGRLDRTQIF